MRMALWHLAGRNRYHIPPHLARHYTIQKRSVTKVTDLFLFFANSDVSKVTRKQRCKQPYLRRGRYFACRSEMLSPQG